MQAHAGIKPEAIGEHTNQASEVGLRTVGAAMQAKELCLKTIKSRRMYDTRNH